MFDSLLEQHREFLKDTIRQKIDFSQTDQSRRVAPPPLEKPFSADATRIRLVTPDQWQAGGRTDLASAIRNRQSRREFTGEPLKLAELSFLLWATQGIRERLNKATALRMVPSAGARHALDTYLCVFNVEGLMEPSSAFRERGRFLMCLGIRTRLRDGERSRLAPTFPPALAPLS